MADESKDPGTTTEAPDTATAEPVETPAEEPKAEETPAEEPKAEETPAEEPKAEETPAEEPKAEETPAEEPKAEETPAEEPKAEEPKAEEPKTAEEPKKAEESKKAKSKGEVKGKLELQKNMGKPEAKTTKRIGETEEESKSAQEIFLENLPTIVVVALIFIIVPLLITSRQLNEGKVSETAWAELGEAKQQRGTEPFAALVKKHKGTEAAPFIKITWASRLYETGEKAKVEQARDLLQQVLRDHGTNAFIKRNVPLQIERIEAELNNPKTPWTVKAQAPLGKGDPDKQLGPDEGHSEDDGHGHGKKTAKKTG